jgi:phage terminase large subunit-like protein
MTTRRARWEPGTSDIFTKYARIKPRWKRAIAFIEGECLVPAGRGAGKPYKLLPFQKRLIKATLSDAVLEAYWSLPRGAGKTSLSAPLLVFFLFDRIGASVICGATGMRGAKLAYDKAVTIIKRNPRLNEQCRIFENAAEPHVDLPHRSATMLPLPATEAAIVGQGPSEALIDEVGYVEADTLEAIATGMGKIDGSLLLCIGTPGVGTHRDGEANPMWRRREMANGDNPPPGMIYLEHAAPMHMDPSSPKTWAKANPGLGIFVDPRVVAKDYATLRLSRFRQMRLGQWGQAESAWMPEELWNGLSVEVGDIPDGAIVALGFDGSVSGDCTALVAFELSTGRFVVLGVWERDPGVKHWQVPRAEVVAEIDRAFTRLTVVALYADPWYWRSEMQELAQRYGERVVEWNTGAPSRMGPATDAMYQAVATREVCWDGDERMKAHMLAAVAKQTAQGDVIQKDARKPQKIDLAVAAILAHEAARLTPIPEPPDYSIY